MTSRNRRREETMVYYPCSIKICDFCHMFTIDESNSFNEQTKTIEKGPR